MIAFEWFADRLEPDSKLGEVTCCCWRGEFEDGLIDLPPADDSVFGGAEFIVEFP